MPATGASGGGPPRDSAEGVAAGAGAARVGVVDREALLLDGVGEVDRRAVEVGSAHPVDDDLDPAEVADQVTVEGALVEVELVDQAGAATGLHAHAQAQVVATLLLEQALDLGSGDVGQQHAVRGLGLGGGGLSLRVVLNTHETRPSCRRSWVGPAVPTREGRDVFPAFQGYVLGRWRLPAARRPGCRHARGACGEGA